MSHRGDKIWKGRVRYPEERSPQEQGRKKTGKFLFLKINDSFNHKILDPAQDYVKPADHFI